MKEREFYNQKGTYNHVPLSKKIRAENLIPIDIFEKFKSKGSYFLESAEIDMKWGRYSIIGLPSESSIRVKNGEIFINIKGNEKKTSSPDPLKFIENYLNENFYPDTGELPIFSGGLVGFFGYESIRLIENKLQNTSNNPPHEIEDINLLISDKVIIFDNLEKTLEIVFYSNPNIENSYKQTLSEIDKLIERLRSYDDHKDQETFSRSEISFKSNMNFEQYSKCIEKIKDYIVEGDVMQVVFAQERSAEFDLPPFELYKSLRKLNPSPYMFFFDFGDYQLVGSSPEILVRLENRNITVRPIAGTKPRGQNEKEDKELEDELKNDPKELAEHLMLIDLGRNDIGRVAEIGSVNTNEKMIIERYSHVMHLVSNVVGKVRDNISPIDALRATFPAGTLTGAPKVRAMEIIDELEVSRRRIYGGAVGYISWSGNMDTAIVIRSAVIKDKKIYVGAGGGIVADSVAEKEWEEVNNKSMAIVKAINNIGS
tara:strand:- start:1466 stop:2917 length:1452 start_codon:yes stop_codon:yes gene_type:complete